LIEADDDFSNNHNPDAAVKRFLSISLFHFATSNICIEKFCLNNPRAILVKALQATASHSLAMQILNKSVGLHKYK